LMPIGHITERIRGQPQFNFGEVFPSGSRDHCDYILRPFLAPQQVLGALIAAELSEIGR
jgi:hypothetical protein